MSIVAINDEESPASLAAQLYEILHLAGERLQHSVDALDTELSAPTN